MKLRGVGGLLIVGAFAAGGAWLATSPQAQAQVQPNKPSRAKPVQARPTPAGVVDRPAREIDLTGRVVSVHAYMAGAGGADAMKATVDALRAGGAAALESPMGLIILGQGNTGGLRTLLPLANQEVEVHGKLYEKGGVKYLDITTINAAQGDEEGDEEEEEEGE